MIRYALQLTEDSDVGFFFQAEDGIRDRNVTGVQTCALPISCRLQRDRERAADGKQQHKGLSTSLAQEADQRRSEERRVGKECRSRGSPYHYKKRRHLKRKLV